MNEYLDLVADRENDKHAEVAMVLWEKFREEVDSLLQSNLLMALNDIHYQIEALNAARGGFAEVVEVAESIDVRAIMDDLRIWIDEERVLLAEALSILAGKVQMATEMEA